MSTQPPDLSVVGDDGVTKGPNGASPRAGRPKKALPTNRMAFTKQLDVLRAWAIASGPECKPVTIKEVGEIVRLHPDTVTLANSFFVEAGLLTKMDNSFTPTATTIAFNQAYDWTPETAAHKLAPAFEQAWFGRALLPRVKMAPLNTEEALGVLAAESQAGPAYKNQLGLLLDYMAVAGLIVHDAGQVRAARPSANGATSVPATNAPTDSATPSSDKRETPKATVTTTFTQPTEGQVQFNVSVRVSMSEFAGWSPDRISSFFAGIAAVLAAKAGIEQEVTGS